MAKARNRILNLAVAAVLGMSAAEALGSDVLSYWNFNNAVAGANGTLGSFNATGTTEVFNASNITLSPATGGVFAGNSVLDLSNLSGTNGGVATNNWGTFGGNVTNVLNGDPAGQSLAIVGSANNGKYITFSVPTTGYENIQVSYATRITSTGSPTEDWQYSVDGTHFTDLSNVTLPTNGAFSLETVDFTGANSAIENQSTVFFRMVLGTYGGTANAGNNRIDNLQIMGTLIPTTPQLVWVGGNGTWDTTGSNWSNGTGTTAWNNTTIGTTTVAAFNTPSAVTIDSGGVTAAGLDFKAGSSGVSLSGPGTLTLANSTITVDGSSTATISAQISGTMGITLGSSGTGSGTLALTNSTNNFTGTVTVSGATLSISSDGALGSGSNPVNLQSAKLVTTAPITTARSITVSSASTIDTQANAVSLTSPLTGSGALTKQGTGTLTLSGNGATTFTGGMNIQGGRVVLNSVDGNGVSGAGTGAISIQDGATLSLEGGFGLGSSTTAAPSMMVGTGPTGGTLQAVNGNITTTGGTQSIGTAAGNATLAAVNAGDALVIGTALRNGGGGLTSQAVVHVTGAGKVQLTSGAVSSSTKPSTPQFSGSWEVMMDQNTGVFSLGPILPGGVGEVLNAAGYPAPAVGGTAAYAGQTNPIKIDSGTVAFGADQANPAASSVTPANSFRSPLTLNGGKIASTGLDYSGDGSADGAPVTANLAADITMNAGATSTVLLYDPVAGVGAGGRSLNIMNDPNAALPDGTLVSSNITWGQNSTLVVDAGQVVQAGSSFVPGALNLVRTTGTVTVGTGATLQINNGAVVQLGGSMDALSDGAHNVGVLNNGTLNVTAGVKHAGAINGSGSVEVSDGTSLTADHVVQASLTIDGAGAVAIRAGGGNNGTSKISTLTIAGSTGAWTADLNIADNKLIVEATPGTKASVLSQTQDQVAFGKTHSAGITTTTLPANMAVAVVDNAVVSKTSFGGVPVDPNSVLVAPELLGDANIDGHVDLSDLAAVLNNFGKTTAAWTSGNFDGSATIDSADLNFVLNNFGASNASAPAYSGSVVAAAPEPASLALLGVGAVALVSRRRKV